MYKETAWIFTGQITAYCELCTPGRVFICRLLNLLCKFPHFGTHKLTEEAIKDVKWWKTFLPEFNGVGILWLEEWQPDVFAASDTCLTGAGGWCQGNYFHAKFPSHILWEQHPICSASWNFNLMCDSQAVGWKNDRKETLICMWLWGHCECHKFGKLKDTFMQKCLRELTYVATKYQFYIHAKHSPGKKKKLGHPAMIVSGVRAQKGI